MLDLRDLRKHYQVGAGVPIRAIDGVTLHARAGQFVAIYGPSGSGKTTLLELIAGALRPDSGSIRVGGTDLLTLSERELDDYRLNTLGVIAHPANLIPGAYAIENASLRLLLTRSRKANRTLEPLMARLGLGERIEHRTEELSMGERQRVMIALALATDPKLVVADEPTGNLDRRLSRDVLSLLREVCAERGATMVLATHDAQAAAFADQTHELSDGKLHAYRPLRDLTASIPPCRR